MAQAFDKSQVFDLANITPRELRQVFDMFDTDASGAVDYKELHHAMQMLGVKCNINSAKKVLTTIDLDGNQQIEWEEFQKFFSTVSSSEELKQLLSKENQRYFEYKEMVENDNAFSKTFAVPPSKPAAKKCMGHNDSVEHIAWLGDTRLISGSCDGGICIWDTNQERKASMITTGAKQIRSDKKFSVDVNKSAMYSMAVSRDGQRLLAGLGCATGNLSFYNIQDGSHLCMFDGQDAAVYACELTADGTQVASASQKGTMCIHDVERPDVCLLRWKAHSSVVHSVSFRSPTMERGTVCTASADGFVKIFDTRSRAQGTTSEPEKVAEIPDAAASETVYQAIFRKSCEIITCGEDDCIKRWDQRALKTGCLSAFFGHTSPVKAIALSPDEKFIVSGTHNGSVRIWLADEVGTIQEKEAEALRNLNRHTQKCSEQEEAFQAGQMDEVAYQEYQKRSVRTAEFEAEVKKYTSAHEQRASLDCTQACFSLDGPTLPVSSLAWRDVGGSAWIATGCQDPFVRLYGVDKEKLSDVNPWGHS